MTDYTIFIRKREYKVPLYVYLAHSTGQFKYIQPYDIYSLFVRDYIIPHSDLINYLKTIVTNKYNKPLVLKKNLSIREPIFNVKYSIILGGWLMNMLYEAKGRLYFPKNITLSDVINKHINFNYDTNDKNYSTLIPHINFYRKLAIGLDLNCKDHPVYIRHNIYKSDIEEVLKEMNSPFQYIDIKGGIEKHNILLNYKDHYIWGSNQVLKWLTETHHTTLYKLNVDKLSKKL